MAERLLTTEEAAKRLHISENALTDMARRKEITAFRVGRLWRFAPDIVEEFRRPKLVGSEAMEDADVS